MIKEFFICILRNKVMGDKKHPKSFLFTSGVQVSFFSLRSVGEGMPETLDPVPVAAGEVGHFHRSAAILDGDAAQFGQ